MEVDIKKELTVKIELTRLEAKWLKLYMKNSLKEDESSIDYSMRKLFFDSLDDEDLK